MARTTLRLRLTLVQAALAATIGVLLLLLSMVLVDRALGSVPLPAGLGLRFPDGRFVTLSEFSDQLRRDALSTLVRQGLGALVLLGALAVGLAWLLTGRVLRPLQQITSTARRLQAERLDARIGLEGPDDELKELADTFDAMLERLERSFEAQRRFVADASHELRTPLAVMRTEVDVALADPDASVEDLRAAAAVVRSATERADRLVDSLLLLARSDRLGIEGLPLRERVELPAAAEQALAAVSAEVEQRGLQVSTAYAPVAVLGDRGLLERLVGNLIENGVRHNVDGGWLRVETARTSGRVRLQVSSSGPVVRADEVEGLFEPFRRAGTARTARRGAGLGLAIVRAVVTAHGGTVTAAPVDGGGLRVTVELPPSP